MMKLSMNKIYKFGRFAQDKPSIQIITQELLAKKSINKIVNDNLLTYMYRRRQRYVKVQRLE